MEFDSLIFDMDGTLWDAVDSYCKVWDVTFAECGINHPDITREQLISFMGMTIDKIIQNMIPEAVGNKEFYQCLDRNEQLLMPRLGGKLYPGVKELIPELARRYRLFMVSNCADGGLPNFLEFTGLKPYFTDTRSYGQTKLDKAANIRQLIAGYGLKSPMYVGDTQGDADASAKAGIPVAWAAYGFGHIEKPNYTLSRFYDLKDILL